MRSRNLACLALAAACLTGCRFVLDDPYGDYLQKAVAWRDLRSDLGSAFHLDTIEGMTIARAGSKSLLFARLEDGAGASIVRALDPQDLKLDSFSIASSGAAFCVSADARISESSVCSRSMIAFGVPAGARMPHQLVAS